MIINAGLIVKGEEFEPLENGHIEIVGGVIAHVGRGHVNSGNSVNFKSGVILPALINSHIHVFDYAFPEAGIDLDLASLVEQPTGLKHRLLGSLRFEELVKAASECRKILAKQGVLSAIVFAELGVKGVKAALGEAKAQPSKFLILGRPIASNESEISKKVGEVVSYCHGLGLDSPLRYSINALKKIRRTAGDKIIMTHVSEDPLSRDRGDFRLAMDYLKSEVMIHCVHLTDEEIAETSEKGIEVVVCPRSNMWFGVGLPPIRKLLEYNVTVALGTDNAGWIKPDLWREMEAVYNILRLKGNHKVEPREILKAATVNAARILRIEKMGVLEEGYKASLIVLDGESTSILKAHNKIAAIVKRGSAESVLYTLP